MTRIELLAIAKPILFNTEMVRAILDGRKTVTRRVAFPNKDLREFPCKQYPEGWWLKGRVYKNWANLPMGRFELSCKYGVSDILYVRETWCKYDEDHVIDGVKYAYKANATPVSEEARNELGYKWKPSIHMPKEAARIFLRVTDVRVERLQDITVNQSTKEGCVSPCCMCRNKKDGKCVGDSILLRDCPIDRIYSPFIGIWNTTVKKSDLELYGWTANPWVWVIEFERIEVTR